MSNPNWDTKPLGEILNTERLEQVRVICSSHRNDSLAMVKALKAYFATFADELEIKGVLPDFLAYAIVAKLSENPV